MATNLRNKKILITAGPTWVAIDNVRVISNIASGITGILLSEELRKQGARVTLVLGPVDCCCLNKGVRLIRYRYFDQLKRIIAKEAGSKKYDILIQTAAVSDYEPQNKFNGKISSGKKSLTLKLVPTAKIIDIVKKKDPGIFLVGFKLEPQAGRNRLLSSASKLIDKTGSDLVVANTFKGNKYRAFIVDSKRIYASALNKTGLVRSLVKVLNAMYK